MATDPLNQQDSKKRPLNNYMKYSAMGFQMAVTVLVFTWCGMKLDKYFEMKFPIFGLGLCLISVFVALYLALKDFIKK